MEPKTRGAGQLRAKGDPCRTLAEAREADEVALESTGSKTDQYEFGELRNHCRTDAILCSVQAMFGTGQYCPTSFTGGSEAVTQELRHRDDNSFTREEVWYELKLATTTAGRSSDQIGARSLRIGKAADMYHEYRSSRGPFTATCGHRMSSNGPWKTTAADNSALVAPRRSMSLIETGSGLANAKTVNEVNSFSDDVQASVSRPY